MAAKGAQLLTERDDGPGGDEIIDGSQAGTPGLSDRGGDRQQRGGGQGGGDDDNIDYVIEEDDQGAGAQGGGEARLTQDEAGDRTLLDQRRQDQVKVYTRAEIDAMSPDERRKAWRDMDRDEQRANRQLDRVRKKDSRAHGRAENESLRGELNQTRQELERLQGQVNGFTPKFGEFEKGQLQSRLGVVETELTRVNTELNDAKRRIAEAVVAADGDAVASAMEARDVAFVKRLQLNGAKEVLTKQITAAGAAGGDGDDRRGGGEAGERQQQRQNGGQQRQQQQQAKELSPAAKERVTEFGEQYPWFNGKDQRDPDSQLVLWIDHQVTQQGFDPASQDYWDEVEEMMEKYLPHRMGRQGAQQQRQRPNGQQRQQGDGNGARRGPPTGGGGDGARGAQRQVGVKLTQARKDALILAGVLDRDGRTVMDKGKFKRQLASFAAYDRENGEART